MSEIVNTLISDITKTLGPLTMSLRRSALSNGWPPELANSLDILFEDEKLQISYPPNVSSDVNSWEYGTEYRRPTAVIRKFMNRMDSSMASTLSEGRY